MSNYFKTRGAVISVSDLTFAEWPERAAENGLTTIGIHPWPVASLGDTMAFMESDAGARFLDKCERLGLQVEYEIHALEDLLPRSLFGKNPDMFRMNESGDRVSDLNLCPSNMNALDIVAGNAAKLCSRLKSTTGRYFLWGSDAYGWCNCPKCREFTDSDQALIVENEMLKAIRTADARATLAHIAYCRTAPAPRVIRPDDGIFLEFAPIHRKHDIPYARQSDCEESLEHLDANLEIFDHDSAQVLEYWLDASLFSDWKRPPKQIPWSSDIFKADINTYGSRGIKHITTFACFVDAEYISLYGEPPIRKYGDILRGWRPE